MYQTSFQRNININMYFNMISVFNVKYIHRNIEDDIDYTVMETRSLWFGNSEFIDLSKPFIHYSVIYATLNFILFVYIIEYIHSCCIYQRTVNECHMKYIYMPDVISRLHYRYINM